MDLIISILYALLFVINVWMFLSFFYYTLLSFWGYRTPKKYAAHPPESRFLVIIPACNEECVIADIVRSIHRTDYPQALIDVYVIADNCTDRTKELALAAGAHVIETFSAPGEPIGKPHAIKKALDQHPHFYQDYDLLTIFDADNVISEGFFAEMNSQYLDEGKPAAIQGYLGCKNKDGIVAFFYYHSYTMMGRFFQIAKYRLGINNSIGGTGFVLSLEALERVGGWQANSLTEDIELQIKLTQRGERILWNHHARVYDEKPTSAAVAFRQRVRWSQGHWYVSLHNAKPLWQAYRAHTISLKELLSSFCYMFSMPASFQLPLLALLMIVLIATNQFHFAAFLGLVDVPWWRWILLVLPFLYSLYALFFFADKQDNGQNIRVSSFFMVVLSYIVMYPLSLFTQVVGFAKHKNQHLWVKTEHEISVSTHPMPVVLQKEETLHE